ncbi:MAG: glucokinase [Sphingomonadales bacterium]|nr:glucokinase [Sphingomonadales bacterium]
MQLVAIDIGGTNARFAIATVGDDGVIALGEPVVLESKAHASFETAWAHFRELHPGPLPRDAALALAGPVERDEITFASIPHWRIARAGLESRMEMDRIVLVNDFGAMGHAVARSGPAHFRHLAGPEIDLPASGTLSVVGPGTGLGVAHVWRDGKGFYHVQSTEGGHIDFAPIDAVDDALLVRLRARHRRVSVERVVSGPAIVDIYETLAGLEGRAIVPIKDGAVWKLAEAGDDPLAAAAAERFCLSLGSAAGDYALAQGACGVVIAGGVAQRQAERLCRSAFAQRFTAKGRFESLMATIPVKLITHPQPGLLGAAAAFVKEMA